MSGGDARLALAHSGPFPARTCRDGGSADEWWGLLRRPGPVSPFPSSHLLSLASGLSMFHLCVPLIDEQTIEDPIHIAVM